MSAFSLFVLCLVILEKDATSDGVSFWEFVVPTEVNRGRKGEGKEDETRQEGGKEKGRESGNENQKSTGPVLCPVSRGDVLGSVPRT